MDASSKEALLRDAQEHVTETVRHVESEIPATEKSIEESFVELRHGGSSQSTTLAQRFLEMRKQKLAHLQDARRAPYFARCDIATPDESEKRLYFGKFSLPELHIYSWAAPAARIRFNEPGDFSYESEAGKRVSGFLGRVDQYLIAEGQIRFMATATRDEPRTLVYQDKFSAHKSSFMLPEIVERMEKAQDDIIRAGAHGSFLISGPAGSGKTTLALHRIAYVLQSPEYAEQFDPRNILVLVQDKHSKQYFEQLLPSLGINNVSISTYDLWAMNLLDIQDAEYVPQFGPTEQERDLLAASKYRALKQLQVIAHTKNPFALLEKIYDAYLPEDQKKLFAKQKKARQFDRIDLTALLRLRLLREGALKVRGRIYTPKKDGTMKSKEGEVALQYAMVLLDEVQNYLAEQIAIIKSCISEKTEAMVYVGDLAQQTSLFTLREWSQVGEQFADGRAVHLYKVYRSTRQILTYIKSLDFAIDVPEGVRAGDEVQEHYVSKQEIQQKVRSIVEEKKDVLVGIIGLNSEDIHPYRALESEHCKVMTAVEAQGLEFDVVVLVHNADALFPEYDDVLREEKRRVVRDQVYVALTRAMNELYVVGEVPLKQFFSSLS